MNNLEKVLLPRVSVLPFNAKSAYICGRLRSELEKKGEAISFADLQIASIAIANELTLITGNIRHFQRIKALNSENWLV